MSDAHQNMIDIIETIDDAFYALDREWRFTYINRHAETLWGKRREDLLGCVIWDAFPLAIGSEAYRAHHRAVATGETVRIETVSPVIGKSVDVAIYPRASGLTVHFRDVSARKHAEDRLKLAAVEIDHRAKNILALVQVLVRQTRADTVQDYVRRLTGRLRSLAHAHTLLGQNDWRRADLAQLVEDELASYRAGEPTRVRVRGPSVALGPKAAQSVAMALHELATNAAKYGALSTVNGRVAVTWVRTSDRLTIHWAESGGPAPRPPEHHGTGTTVIERSIKNQLDGAVRFDWRLEGLLCEMTLPAVELVRESLPHDVQLL